MAKMIGEAGRYTTAQAIRLFQRMLFTTMLLVAGLGIFEGVVFSSIVFRWGRTGWIQIASMLLGLLGVFYLCRYQSRRIDHYERERKKWRKGAVGECLVGDVLSALPNNYCVINDVATESGNLDHVVVGPTGVFAIETKNWRGTITADHDGELVQNGKASTSAHIKRFVCRTMAIREQVMTLTRRNELYIKSVMVFPRARVDAHFGTTSHVHCLTDERLCDYIEDPRYARKLEPKEVDQIVRAFTGIAAMDAGFSGQSTAAVNRSKGKPAVVAAISPDHA